MATPKIVTEYGRMWPREVFDILENKTLVIKALSALQQPGVYILYRDESPYYIGKTTKTLFSRSEGGAKPFVFAGRDEREESLFVLNKINELRRQGTPIDEIAVLFRSGFHSYKLELDSLVQEAAKAKIEEQKQQLEKKATDKLQESLKGLFKK